MSETTHAEPSHTAAPGPTVEPVATHAAAVDTHEPAEPPEAPPTLLRIAPWRDPVITQHGFDPRAEYVERFWLGILGPSTTWFLRYLAWQFERHESGFDLDLFECANALGLGGRGGRHSPFMRSIDRAEKFGLARRVGPDTLEVRTHVPPLTRGQINRLSPRLQAEHQQDRAAAFAAPRPPAPLPTQREASPTS